MRICEKCGGRGILTWDNDIEGRWRDYFVQLLDGTKLRKVGRDVRRMRIGGNERVVRKVWSLNLKMKQLFRKFA